MFSQQSRVVTPSSLASKHGFSSAAAVQWALTNFGDLDAGSVFQMTSKQQQVVRSTAAVSAVRSRGNSLSADAGGALLKALAPMPPTEVCQLYSRTPCTPHIAPV